MNAAHPTGKLFLVPTPLDFGCIPKDQPPPSIDLLLPRETVETAAKITHWIAENAKSTRAFLKRVDAVHALSVPIQAQQIAELPRSAHKKGDHSPHVAHEVEARKLLAPALEGHNVGLISEAGMPAIADPGSSVVRAAHAMGVPVCPLIGPVSLMLALAASGLNGQDFAFVGYVPQTAQERTARLRELESTATRSGQTQILIETPYRNEALLQALMLHLHPSTRLAVAWGLGLPSQRIVSASINDWRQNLRGGPALPNDTPAVFLIGR